MEDFIVRCLIHLFFQGCSEVPVTFHESLKKTTNLDSIYLYTASWLGVARIPTNEATHRDEPTLCI